MRDKKQQVGGDHYSKHSIQPFDIIDEYNLDYYEGAALKYLLRHKDKNGKVTILNPKIMYTPRIPLRKPPIGKIVKMKEQKTNTNNSTNNNGK